MKNNLYYCQKNNHLLIASDKFFIIGAVGLEVIE